MNRNAWPASMHHAFRAIDEIGTNDDVIARDGVKDRKSVSHAGSHVR
jgi:hypothetical protein